jgi:two-component system, NarL family, response regulator NreC
MPISVLIADDHGVLRAGLRVLLDREPDMQVVGEAADGEEALRLTDTLQPDVVLMDVSMPGESGVEVTRRLKASWPRTQVLILTVHEDSSLVHEAIRAGASGYIVKRAAESELVDAIRAVARGQTYLHPTMTRAVLIEADLVTNSKDDPAKALTPREEQVLRLIARGHTNPEIAELLTISVRTVEGHRSNVMSKLDLHSRVELVRYAAQHGLLDLDAL